MSITSSYFSHVDMLSIVECNCSLTYCFFYFKLVVPFPQTICILPLIQSGFFSSSFNSLNFPQEISSFILQNRCKNGGLKARNISLCTETVESSMLIISVISSQVNYGYYVLCDRKKSWPLQLYTLTSACIISSVMSSVIGWLLISKCVCNRTQLDPDTRVWVFLSLKALLVQSQAPDWATQGNARSAHWLCKWKFPCLFLNGWKGLLHKKDTDNMKNNC